ncbi:DNA-(apurinic or apyrimidinic site) endonuclease 2-like isoform X2 [Myxocyprinus asiaticus]|uniref:DNA-(apurinic or apyrimidinic site) endonuclease 2-like isoform X2 n=1 Tax=Myxocyprinus asiaticus TaxID=70543 RepID=UPI002221CB82|nr:DNA-(apurinic or apyrimidinic site) endonuclease 2-like isoform X2 [Myxocyprinus asiaticus]
MVTSGADGPEKLTVSNVYCPHADLDKLERKQYKLQFYRLLQVRAEAILSSGSHVIVLGDVNTSHQPIDHCEPNDVRSSAFTCWSTLTGARQTNYGTCIDYIFSNCSLVETAFIGADIMRGGIQSLPCMGTAHLYPPA